MVQQELRLSIDEIRENFSKGTVTATLQRAGNRRQGLMEVAGVRPTDMALQGLYERLLA
jgi:hypothetical protein